MGAAVALLTATFFSPRETRAANDPALYGAKIAAADATTSPSACRLSTRLFQ